MRRFFVASTLLFWLLLAAIWAAARWQPGELPTPASAPEQRYTSADLASHATPEDCWMAIRGDVYDLTGYLPDHPSRPALFIPWCGREATEAYNTKTKGRPHSAEADQLLAQYRIGRFAAANP
jgi:cytochrome b involved in lipid metabolism